MSSNTHQAEDETPLCVNCLSPNTPSAHFCHKCGAPMTSYAATGPFESLFAEGHVYRQAVEKPRSLIVVLGIWLIFGTGALFGIGLLFSGGNSSIQKFLISAFLLPISFAMIWKTTHSYLSRPRADGKCAAACDSE